MAKLEGAAPARVCRALIIWWASTLRDQPCSMALVAYQVRVAGSLARASRTLTWPQGSCPTGCWTKSPCSEGGGEGAHGVQVGAGEAALVGEGGAQVVREAFDDLRAPAGVLLAGEDVAADGVVQAQQLGVGRAGGAHALLEGLEQFAVAGGQVSGEPPVSVVVAEGGGL